MLSSVTPRRRRARLALLSLAAARGPQAFTVAVPFQVEIMTNVAVR